MSLTKYTRLLAKDTKGRDVLVIKDGIGNEIWCDLIAEGETFYLDIGTLEEISKYSNLGRVDILTLNSILDNTCMHLWGVTSDQYAIPDQIAFRKFVKAWDEMSPENKRYLGGHIGAIFGIKHSLWPPYEEAQELSQLFNELLELKGRGAPKKPWVTKARDYLFEECAKFFQSRGVRITTSSEDLNFYLIMRAILAEECFSEIRVREIYDHIKRTSPCTR